MQTSRAVLVVGEIMALIAATKLTIDFPIFDSSRWSLKKTLVRAATGGRIANDSHGINIRAIDGISFSIKHGERVGLMGHNGAGKSTLLRAIAGVYAPTYGGLLVEGSIASLLDLSLGMDGEFSGYDNILIRCILMGIPKSVVKKRLMRSLSFRSWAIT